MTATAPPCCVGFEDFPDQDSELIASAISSSVRLSPPALSTNSSVICASFCGRIAQGLSVTAMRTRLYLCCCICILRHCNVKVRQNQLFCLFGCLIPSRKFLAWV